MGVFYHRGKNGHIPWHFSIGVAALVYKKSGSEISQLLLELQTAISQYFIVFPFSQGLESLSFLCLLQFADHMIIYLDKGPGEPKNIVSLEFLETAYALLCSLVCSSIHN